MMQRDILLVRETMPMLLEVAEPAAQLFYGRLFQSNPAVRPLFRGDVMAQGKKFMDMLISLSDSLDDLDSRKHALFAMGQRHAGYGVVSEQYGAAKAAFLWTLKQTLEAEFTPPVEAAWGALIDEIATAMQAGAAQLPSP